MAKDYYATLGVSKDAGPDELKKAFRRLARESHPDANPDDPTAEARFKEIAEAYEVLSDPEKRRAYDRGETFDLGDLLGGFGLDDLLRSVFGDGGLFGTGRGAMRRGRDLMVTAKVSLEEAAFGTTSEVAFRAASTCSTCAGTGAAAGTVPSTCSQCGGSGAVRMGRRTVFGTMMSVVDCDLCDGSGSLIERPCAECGGRGSVVGPRTVLVEIPPGVADGTRLRLTGQGEAGERGAGRGDLYVEVAVTPHESFVRSGDDLVHRAQIGIAQAALGTTIEVPLIDGSTTELKIPPGTQPAATFSFAGEGMTRLGRRGRGDLIVEVNVVIPTKLSGAAKAALETYAAEVDEKTGRRRRR